MPGSGFVMFFALTVSGPRPTATPTPAPPAVAAHAWSSVGATRSRTTAGSFRSDELFSLRERRRIAAYLRMRLLEMREAGLERAAAAVERRLPADALLPAGGLPPANSRAPARLRTCANASPQ